VVLTGRDPAKVAAAAQMLCNDGLVAASHGLDITQDDSAAACTMWTKQTHGAFDVLMNNAGIFLVRIYGDSEIIETNALDVVEQVLDSNLLGPLPVIQHLAPLLRSGGRVVNMSSQAGQLAWADSNMVGYCLFKTALNGLTANLAPGLKERGITVNCCCPGWVRTDMGSKHAMIDAEKGAQTPVWLAAEADAALTGKFYNQKAKIFWQGRRRQFRPFAGALIDWDSKFCTCERNVSWLRPILMPHRPRSADWDVMTSWPTLVRMKRHG
jgi:NAD(P)-dependent dehydrogenase (short-subunit alcohol dehydrogenase family)